MQMYAAPFVAIPRAITVDATLSPGSRALWAILKDHARQRETCVPGYARLCALMGRCENTVRKYMRELIGAGIVEQTRRGHMRTNRYRLASPALEPQFVRPELYVLEDSKGERFDSLPPSLHFASETECTDLDPTEPASPPPVPPLPPPVAMLAADLGREFRDAAPRSTQTRVARLHTRSGMTAVDFAREMHAARSITRQRFARIRKRNRAGQCLPMAYLLAVVEQRVTGECPARARPPTRPAARHADVSQNAQTVDHPPLPERSLTEAYSAFSEASVSEERAAFWQAVSDATGGTVSDLAGYCRVAKRPPPGYDNLVYALTILREARQQ